MVSLEEEATSTASNNNNTNTNTNTNTTTTTTTKGGKLLRFFSRDVAAAVSPKTTKQIDGGDDEVVEATWRCTSEEIDMEIEDEAERTTRSRVGGANTKSILKIKTQKESLGKPYPKPYVRLDDTLANQKEVTFSMVTIQRYPIILGDHPCATGGPPITIDWEVCHLEEMTVAQHFTMNPWRQLSSIRNRQKLFLLSRWTRERMLLARGYTLLQLRQAETAGEQIRLQRYRNAIGYPIWLHPLLEKLGLATYNVSPKLIMKYSTNKKGKKKKESKKKKQQQQKRGGGEVDKELLRCV